MTMTSSSVSIRRVVIYVMCNEKREHNETIHEHVLFQCRREHERARRRTRVIPVWSKVYGLRHAALSEGYVSLQAVRRTLSKILYSPLGRTLRSRLHMKLRKLRESSRLW